MKAKLFLIIDAIILLLFAMGYLLTPQWTLAQFDITVNDGGVMMAQLFGAAILGIAVLNWMSREAHYFEELRPVALGNCVGHGLVFVVLLLQKLNGLGNGFCWFVIAFALIFTLAFGYFAFVRTGIERPDVTPKPA